jgi:hypothetical protein
MYANALLIFLVMRGTALVIASDTCEDGVCTEVEDTIADDTSEMQVFTEFVKGKKLAKQRQEAAGKQVDIEWIFKSTPGDHRDVCNLQGTLVDQDPEIGATRLAFKIDSTSYIVKDEDGKLLWAVSVLNEGNMHASIEGDEIDFWIEGEEAHEVLDSAHTQEDVQNDMVKLWNDKKSNAIACFGRALLGDGINAQAYPCAFPLVMSAFRIAENSATITEATRQYLDSASLAQTSITANSSGCSDCRNECGNECMGMCGEYCTHDHWTAHVANFVCPDYVLGTCMNGCMAHDYSGNCIGTAGLAFWTFASAFWVDDVCGPCDWAWFDRENNNRRRRSWWR